MVWNKISLYQSYLKNFNLLDLDSKVIDLSGGEQKKILLSLGLSNDSGAYFMGRAYKPS